MNNREDKERRSEELEGILSGEAPLAPQDEALWRQLAPLLPEACGEVALNDVAVQALEQMCPPVTVDKYLMEDLEAAFLRVVQDADYDEYVEKARRAPSLGTYLRFLRERAGISLDEAAKEGDFDFQTLADLEQDRLRVIRVPPQPISDLVYHLQGTREKIEQLLPYLLQEPPYIASGIRGGLYRGAPGSDRASSERASLSARGMNGESFENPAYHDEVEALKRLLEEIRLAWQRSQDARG